MARKLIANYNNPYGKSEVNLKLNLRKPTYRVKIIRDGKLIAQRCTCKNYRLQVIIGKGIVKVLAHEKRCINA